MLRQGSKGKRVAEGELEQASWCLKGAAHESTSCID
jgi:hypothetical protein